MKREKNENENEQKVSKDYGQPNLNRFIIPEKTVETTQVVSELDASCVGDVCNGGQDEAKKKCGLFKPRGKTEKSKTTKKKKKLSKRKMLEIIFNKLEAHELLCPNEIINKLNDCIEKVEKSNGGYNQLYNDILVLRGLVRELIEKIDKLPKPLPEDSKPLPQKPKGASKDAQASDTLTAIYSVCLEMEKCENFDQIRYQTYRVKKLFEEYENLTGEKLAWRL